MNDGDSRTTGTSYLIESTLSGIAAADLACGIDSPLAQHQGSTATPVRLPPPPVAWLGATAYIRWQERSAGAEL